MNKTADVVKKEADAVLNQSKKSADNVMKTAKEEIRSELQPETTADHATDKLRTAGHKALGALGGAMKRAGEKIEHLGE